MTTDMRALLQNYLTLLLLGRGETDLGSDEIAKVKTALAAPAPEPVARGNELAESCLCCGYVAQRATYNIDQPRFYICVECVRKVRLYDLAKAIADAAPPTVSPDDARDAARYRELSTPEIHDFIVAVEREALHQRDRWGSDHDAGKTDADWFWLIGYVAGKALHKPEKRLHHIITTAAVCLNWHAHAIEMFTKMRPGIEAAIEREGRNE